MAFKLSNRATVSLDSPESLIRDIKTKKIPGPLSVQTDLWREYQSTAINKPDVALRLPTGGGKTLVGLGLAEWRRLKFRERVVVLCPTRQLVNQFAEQSISKYGIKVNAFVGAKADYSKDAASEFTNGECVAITTYSSLFNAAPFFDEPHVIILDDAHASEQYIASMWSISIDRNQDSHRPLYDALIEIIKPALGKADYRRLADPDSYRDQNWVEKIPTPAFEELMPSIIGIFDSFVTRRDYAVSSHKFVWKCIRDHLLGCHMYLAAGKLYIRPWLPPTSTHAPFANAKQRIYMSATLGDAGELERITGRPSILRVQANSGLDSQAIGRRFFLFPERQLDESEQKTLCTAMMQRAGRTLVLTPDGVREQNFRKFIEDNLRYPIFDASSIEQSKEGFISSEKAVAIVANRYDGIDFRGDECRLLIVEGLARGTNLQEQFLITRMGATDLLNMRITTRLVQALGRCTRSDEDYSAVVIRGEELTKHLLKREHREILHPELQAELEFGIDQSKETSIDGHLENFNDFLDQQDNWREANNEIVGLRGDLVQTPMPGAADLADTAPDEIAYQMAIWNGDYSAAFDLARSVVGKLRDPKLRSGRAIWHYLAGSAAWLAYKHGASGFDAQAREQYSAALKRERTVAWLVSLTKLAGITDGLSEFSSDKNTSSVIERLEELFDKLGTINNIKYEKFEAEVRTKIGKNAANTFEDGHMLLGKLLGYESGNRNDTGTPDPWWLVDSSLCFVFEDHSEAQPGSSLSVDKARQAFTHPNWIRENLPLDNDATVVSILITPVKVADDAALPHLRDVLVWNIDEFRSWTQQAIGTIRSIRKTYPNAGDLVWRAEAAEKLAAVNATPNTIIEMLKSRVGANVLKKID